MDPISITFVVVGAVIVCAEAIKYVKKKFFHRTEEHHHDAMVFKAEELTMDSNELLKLAHLNDDATAVADDHHHSMMHGRNIKITVARNIRSVDHMGSTYQERGGSEVAQKITEEILPSMASPCFEIAHVAGTLYDKVSKAHVQNKSEVKFKDDGEGGQDSLTLGRSVGFEDIVAEGDEMRVYCDGNIKMEESDSHSSWV